MASAPQGKVKIFENIHATKQGEGLIVRKGDVAQSDLMRHGLERLLDRASLPAFP